MRRGLFATGVASVLAAFGAEAAASPIQVRVVVVATFEQGPNVGDSKPGELHHWIVQYPLPKVLAFPVGYQALHYNPDEHVLGIVTGAGKAHAAASIMALGTDPRFDLRKAYWVLAGIAGVDPHKASIGSAAWGKYVIDGDMGYEIDPREIPADWPTGMVPYDRSKPYQEPAPPPLITPITSLIANQAYKLNAGLVRWAYALTKDVTLPDDDKLKTARAAYPEYPNAQKPPFVLIGDTMVNDPFWIGAKFTEFGEKWTDYWTHGDGNFVMAACEDTGYMQALAFLAQAHRVDMNRVMDLRTASDFTIQPAGKTAAEFLAGEYDGSLVAADEAFDSAYRVGEPFVRALATHWDKYADHIPTAP